jgi:DNA polymerase-3 subunit alpha
MVKDSKAKDKNAKCLVSQVTMAEVEEMGLLKMDFLGLKTMSVIGDCLKTVNRIRNLQGLQPVNYYMDVPLSDPYVYAEISEGNTYAIFQIESEGMRSFMKELFSDVKEKISVIESKYSFTGFGEFATGIGTDFSGYIQEMSTFGEELFERMIAGVSLYRPGPMDYIPDYIRGMNNPEGIVYDTPLLEPILKPTYGVIVYQEQVMDIVRSLAGFTAGQSDTIRKAMGKKKQSILDEYKPYFIEGSGSAVDGHSGSPLDIKGCVENGILRETAEAIWEKMADFAKYAFNKSHAAAYSVLTVVCAWLKHYYPAPYMCATLNTYMDNNEKLAGYISNTKDMGIGIIPPSVNKSGEAFKTNGKQILFGLKGLKGVSKTVSLIIKEREDNGEYTSITDFVARTYPLGVAKKSFEALNYSGCFDNFGKTRNAVASATEVLMDKGKNLKARIKKENENQLSFFDMLGVSENEINYEIPDKPEFPEREKLRYEHEVASIYISAHPLDSYSERLKELGVSELSDIKDNEGNVSEGSFTFAGEVGDIREIITRKGDKMATFVLSDRSSSIKVTVFPKDYETARLNLANNSLVVVKGNVRNDENYGVQLILSTVIDIDRIPDSAGVSRVMVNIPDFTNTAANDLKRIMRDYPGNTEIFVKSGEKTLKSADGISATSGLFMALHNRFGYENVYFE